ncbi:MAG: hypothetical protein ACFB4I_02515 [Cyanophyceae cyanobacterium]
MYVSESPDQTKPSASLDPEILSAAQRIYRTFCEIHTKGDKQPLGVAINPKTCRGQVICNKRLKPILLFGEYFVESDALKTS